MELIERYVHDVGRRLPRHLNSKTRADIQAELRSSLLDSLDEASQGEISDEQVAALLQEFGPPIKVAASYYPQDQYLIGPDLFPLYRMVVGIVLAALTGALLLAMGIGALVGGEALPVASPLGALDFIAGLIGSLISAFGMVTLVFATLQYFGVRPETEDEPWQPSDLPPVPEESDQIGRGGTIFEIAVNLVLLAILWFAPGLIGVVTSPSQTVLTNPVIVDYIPLISVALLVALALDLFLLWRGRWTSATRLAKIGENLLSIYVLSVLVVGHTTWLAEHGAGGFFGTLEGLSASTITQPEFALTLGMQAFRLAFVVALIVISIETLGLLYKLIKRSFTKPVTIAPAQDA